jgi:Ca-activated chloride channel family protein
LSSDDKTRRVDAPEATVLTGPERLALQVIPGSSCALSTRNTRALVLFRVTAPGRATGRRAPLNLSLVIDRSGSMEGEPLEFAKQACAHVVDQLQPDDVLSVIAFDEQAEVVMPARRVINKTLVKSHIEAIQPGKTTNLYDAIVSAGQQVRSVPSEGYATRVILLTDGAPTVGITDFASLAKLVTEQKKQGITISGLGFGIEYNEELMATIARRSGGRYYYIERPDQIPQAFEKELASVMALAAKNVRLSLALSRWVFVRRAFGKDVQQAHRRVEWLLPDLEAGATAESLVELELQSRPGGEYRVARAELQYQNPLTGARESVQENVLLTFVADEAKVEASRNPEVAQRLEVALASQQLEKTMVGLRTQQISKTQAIQSLEAAKTQLLQQGKADEAAQVDRAIQKLQAGTGDAEKTLIGTIAQIDAGTSEGGS